MPETGDTINRMPEGDIHLDYDSIFNNPEDPRWQFLLAIFPDMSAYVDNYLSLIPDDNARLNAKIELVSLLCKVIEAQGIDPITGLYNRAYAQEMLRSTLLTVRRLETISFEFIFLDLDRFSDVNLSYGHAVGDSVLAHAARVLQSSVRIGDKLVRWGGDEFIAILEHAPGEYVSADHFIDRINARMAENPYNQSDIMIPMRVTCGHSRLITKDDLQGKNIDSYLKALLEEANFQMLDIKREKKARGYREA